MGNQSCEIPAIRRHLLSSIPPPLLEISSHHIYHSITHSEENKTPQSILRSDHDSDWALKLTAADYSRRFVGDRTTHDCRLVPLDSSPHCGSNGTSLIHFHQLGAKIHHFEDLSRRPPRLHLPPAFSPSSERTTSSKDHR
ncbi:UNVERIFIED_CONTAM: hypothetical protein Sindi_1381700 [Sesamum indicum]